MPLERHPLTKEFPEYEPLIPRLKDQDSEFAEMLSQYNELDRRIYRFEEHAQPISDESLEQLKFRRAELKDRLYLKLREAAAQSS